MEVSMTTPHPAWCTDPETDDHEEHVSETLHAARPNDVLDIRVRLTEPKEDPHLAAFELEVIDAGEVFTHPLPLHQARDLMHAMGRLLP
jgi:hypothetical protein